MNCEKIVDVRLSDEQKSYCLDRLHEINTLLKKWSDLNPRLSNRQIRTLILDSKRTHLLEVPQDRLHEFLADINLIRQVRNADPFLQNRSIEFALLQNYSHLADKFARMWHRKHDINHLAYEDFLQECYLQVTEAMYGWFKDRGADLTTYLWWSLKNRLINVVNQQGATLSHLTNGDIKLLNTYKKISKNNHHLSQDNAIDSLNLSQTDRENLVSAIVSLRTIRNSEDGTNSSRSRSTVFFDRSADENEQQEFVDHIIDRSGLTNFERELILQAMNPFYGWQSQFAKRICPVTQKPYGRQRIGLILTCARKKLAMAYERICR